MLPFTLIPGARSGMKYLADLPDEILNHIFSFLNLHAIFRVSLVSRHLRNLIRQPHFGSQVLEQASAYLSIDAQISLKIGRLDKMDICRSGNTLLILHTTPDSSHLYQIFVTRLGLVKYQDAPLDDRILCTLKNKEALTLHGPVSLSPSHHLACSFCARFHVHSYEYYIDKDYDVFMQTFADKNTFILQNGAKIQITLVHTRDAPSFWSELELRPPRITIQMARYGLAESTRLSKRMLIFFKIKGEIPDLSSPLRSGTNPFA